MAARRIVEAAYMELACATLREKFMTLAANTRPFAQVQCSLPLLNRTAHKDRTCATIMNWYSNTPDVPQCD
eukprot:6491329-Amphidinium_carterae.2